MDKIELLITKLKVFPEFDKEVRGILKKEFNEDYTVMDVTFIALKKKELIGICNLKSEGLWLNGLFVKPEYRKRGIGLSLVDAVIDEVKEDLFLSTKKEELIPFFKKKDFKEYDKKDSFIIMKREY